MCDDVVIICIYLCEDVIFQFSIFGVGICVWVCGAAIWGQVGIDFVDWCVRCYLRGCGGVVIGVGWEKVEEEW